MPNLPDIDNCRSVCRSGLLFAKQHLEALKEYSQGREPESVMHRAMEFGLEMHSITVEPGSGLGIKAANKRTVGVYEHEDAASAAWMWLVHYNHVRKWGLRIDHLRYNVALKFHEVVESVNSRHTGATTNVDYGILSPHMKREKLPGYSLIFPTPIQTTRRRGNTVKQSWSAAQRKWDLMTPGMQYQDFVKSCKAVPALKNRTALEWDIKRGYLHVMPS